MNEKEARKQKRLERLETNHPCCVVCGEPDSKCLERHHIAGRKYGDELAIVCRNCHRKLSDDQKDHPAGRHDTSINVVRLGLLLLGLADLFALIVERFRVIGRDLVGAPREK